MAISQMNGVIHELRKLALAHDGAEKTDGQLLECFVSRREEAALEALVVRHGPMVWGVCRRMLHDHHDAEDAFQATFLVLVRKAASIAQRELVGNWLYGVAHQAALNARTRIARRRAREVQVMEMPEPAVTERDLWPDLQPLLDQELTRLPDKYRVAIVLCDLEGKGRKDVARQLGLPEGTVASRLARGRALLAKRLARHGLVVSGGMLAAVLPQQAASAAAPTAVMTSTCKAVALVAAGQAAATGVISGTVAALTEGVMKAMFLTKLMKVTGLLLVVAALSSATGLIYQTQANEPPKAPEVSENPKTPMPEADGSGRSLALQSPPRPVALADDAKLRKDAKDDSKLLKGQDKPPAKEKPLSEWIKELKSADKDKRLRAAEAIGRFGPAGKPAVPALQEALADKESAVEEAVCVALWKVDRAAFTALLTDDKDAKRGRYPATLALFRIGKEAKELVPVVLKIAADEQDENCPHALWVLPAISADLDDALPVLEKALQSKDKGNYARMLAAQALGDYGPKAKKALPTLHQALAHPDPQARVEAAGAVWMIERKADKALPVLMEVLKRQPNDRKDNARYRAYSYLEKMGPEAKPAFPVLLALWNDKTTRNRIVIAEALQAIDPQAAAEAGVK